MVLIFSNSSSFLKTKLCRWTDCNSLGGLFEWKYIYGYETNGKTFVIYTYPV